MESTYRAGQKLGPVLSNLAQLASRKAGTDVLHILAILAI